MPQDPQVQLPTLLIAICMMSAMAFVMSTYRWMWAILKNDPYPDRDLKADIIIGQAQALIFSMFVSILVGVYDYVAADRPLRLTGEAIVLIVTAFFAYRAGRSLGGVIRFFASVFAFGLLCLIGWVVTIAIGAIVYFGAGSVAVVSRGDLDVMIVFIAGLAWNAPIFLLAHKIRKTPGKIAAINGKSAIAYLWPILFAYVVLLVPLAVQSHVNSEEWQKMKHVKPIRKV